MSSGEEYTSPATHQGRQKAGAKRRRTAEAVSDGQEQQDGATAREAAATGRDDGADPELEELLRLRQALVRVAREIIVTLGVDPEDGPMPGLGPGPWARGMGRPGMMGRRMRRGAPYWDGPGPIRRMPPPGPRGYPGVGGPGGMGGPGGRRRGGAAMGEDEDR